LDHTEEIDNLTRRSKATESAFDKLTQALHDVQDPSSLLLEATEQLNSQQQQILQLAQKVDEASKENASLDSKLQKSIKECQAAKSSAAVNSSSKEEKEEIIQLRREVAEYEVEFRSLKNQDITIRKLEKRIEELQEGGAAEFEAKLEAAKQELAETEGRRTTEALEREAAMERKVETLQLQLKAEAAGRAATNTHMLQASEGVGEREAAWDAQRRILVDDAERMRVMLHEATRERDELRLKVAALDGSTTGQPAATAPSSGGISMADLLNERKAYEAEVSELSHTVNALREEIGLKDNAMVDENRGLQSKIERLEEENSKLNSELSHTVEQLDAAPSKSLVDGMKRELRILKRLEYNAEDPDMPETDPEIAGRNEDQGKDLESVLVAKLRRIETELVKERNINIESGKERESLLQELKELEQSKKEAETVIATLEKDLDKAISSSTTSPSKPSKPPKKEELPIAPSDPNALQSVLDPNAPPVAPSQSTASSMISPASKTSAEEKIADDHSVANIIMSQRDRLRARCDALELERDSFKRELQAQVDASESLRADNTKLFEKMRYLQSYNKNSSSNRSNVFSRQNSRDLDLEALEQRYEASVDPFRQFSKTERQRKLQEMSPMERTVFVGAKAMLGTKEMRTFLFFYVIAMHLLVFSTTYHWSHNTSGHDCLLLQEQHSHLPPALGDTGADTATS
jgi:homeobox protein cut-like